MATSNDSNVLSEYLSNRTAPDTPKPAKPVSDDPREAPGGYLDRALSRAVRPGAGYLLPKEEQVERFAPTTAGEKFSDAVEGGYRTLKADVKRAGAIYNLLTDEQEKAESFLRQAEYIDEASGELLGGFGNFEDFLAAPTFSGFTDQAIKAIGQFTPMMVSSISAGLAGAATQAVGKGFLSATSRRVLSKEMKDIVQKEFAIRSGIKNAPKLTASEQAILDAAYLTANKAKKMNSMNMRSQLYKAGVGKKTRQFADGAPLSYGFWVGAAGQEYLVGSSQSLAEFQDAGLELTEAEAKQALAMGVPQAAIGLLGENLIAGGLIRRFLGKADAARKAGKIKLAEDYEGWIREASTGLVAGLGRGALSEGATELGQEELYIQQRFSTDPEYTEQEANLRRMESAFAGAIAGGAMKGGVDATARVMDKAKANIDIGLYTRKQATENLEMGLATEPLSYGVAQVKDMFDVDTPRKAVYLDGRDLKDSAEMTQRIEEIGRQLPVEQANKLEVIPGAGKSAILTTAKDRDDILSIVANKGLDDPTALKDILGYSALQDGSESHVVVVRDSNGVPVYYEAAKTTALQSVIEKLEQQYPQDRYSRPTPVPKEQFLEERVQAFNEDSAAPQEVQTRPMIDEDLTPENTEEDVDFTDLQSMQTVEVDPDGFVRESLPDAEQNRQDRMNISEQDRQEALQKREPIQERPKQLKANGVEDFNIRPEGKTQQQITEATRSAQQTRDARFETMIDHLMESYDLEQNPQGAKLDETDQSSRDAFEARLREGLGGSNGVSYRFLAKFAGLIAKNPGTRFSPRLVRDDAVGIGSDGLWKVVVDSTDSDVNQITRTQRVVKNAINSARNKIALKTPPMFSIVPKNTEIATSRKELQDLREANVGLLSPEEQQQYQEEVQQSQDTIERFYDENRGTPANMQILMQEGIRVALDGEFSGSISRVAAGYATLLSLLDQAGFELVFIDENNTVTPAITAEMTQRGGPFETRGIYDTSVYRTVASAYEGTPGRTLRQASATFEPDPTKVKNMSIETLIQKVENIERNFKNLSLIKQFPIKSLVNRLRILGTLQDEGVDFIVQPDRTLTEAERTEQNLRRSQKETGSFDPKPLRTVEDEQLSSAVQLVSTEFAKLQALLKSVTEANYENRRDYFEGGVFQNPANLTLEEFTEAKKVLLEGLQDFEGFQTQAAAIFDAPVAGATHSQLSLAKNQEIVDNTRKNLQKELDKVDKQIQEGTTTPTRNDFLNATLSLSEQRNILQQRLSSLKSLKEQGVKDGDPNLGVKQQSSDLNVDVQSFKATLRERGLADDLIATNHNLEIADKSTAELARTSELGKERPKNKILIRPTKKTTTLTDKVDLKTLDPETGEVQNRQAPALLALVEPMLSRIMSRVFNVPGTRPKQVTTLDNILDGKVTFPTKDQQLLIEDGARRKISTQQLMEEKAKEMRENKERGLFIGLKDADVIILDINETMTEAQYSEAILTLGHELGHIVFREELDRSLSLPGIREKLEKAFEKDITKSQQYQGKHGFEEWYSDNVSKYLLNEGLKATNGVDGWFKRIANRIRQIFKQLSPMYRRRFNVNPVFADYVENVVKKYKEPARLNSKPAYLEKVAVRKIVEENVQQTAKEFGASKGYIASLKRKVDKFLRENPDLLPRDWSKAISHFLFTADNRLRKLSSELARQLYDRSGSDDPRGYLNSRGNIARQFKNRLLEILPAGIATEQVQEILLEAEDDRIPTSQLKSPEAKQIRRFLRDFYNDYIEGSGHNQGNGRVEFRENFFPRVLMIEAIRENPELQTALAELLQRKAGTPTFETTIVTPEGEKVLSTPWQEVVENIIENEERNPDDHIDGAEATSVGMSKNRSDLFNLVSNKELREIGVLQDPGMTILKYIDDMVKRVDYQDKVQTEVTAQDRQTIIAARDAGTINESLARALLSVPVGKTAKGWIAAEYMIQRISDPLQREEAKDLIRGMLGKTGLNMSKGARAASSLLLTLNVVAYLSLATIASLPDLAGPVLRSRDFSAFRTAFQQYRFYFNNRAELQQYARDVGVTTLDSMSMMAINANEMAYMTPGMEKFTDKFFHAIGLEQFTKFTRVFALGMGEKFLINEANRATNSSLSIQERQRAARHLEELGVTAEDVKAWDKTKEAGERYRRFEGESGERVKGALGQFVNESIVRPNSAERPGWASNPYAGVVWQLKSFFYAYGKNIVGGALRDTHSRFSETGSVGDAAVPILIMGTAFLPLTMVGLELREWLKYMFRGGDETALRSDSMDFGEYSAEIIDRSGLLGPWGLLRPMLEAGDFGGSWWVPPLGPTAERVEDIVRGDMDYTTYLPVYSSFR